MEQTIRGSCLQAASEGLRRDSDQPSLDLARWVGMTSRLRSEREEAETPPWGS